MSEYYTLLTSLPHLPKLDSGKVLPITRLALDRRLSMLSEQDSQQLQCLESLYFPEEDTLSQLSDRDVVRYWTKALGNLQSDVLKQRVYYQLEMRSVIAAIRYREADMNHPEHFSGIGRWNGFIRRHWYEPMFSMDEFHPQMAFTVRLLKKGFPGQAESAFLAHLWQDLFYCEKQQDFNFEAVACYVLRWGVLAKALKADAQKTRQIFDTMTNALIGSTSLHDDLEKEKTES
ncbi:hypothetical protein [Neptunomonas concharum]|uniref:DUF2764 family protein n=1 Tax=Neptunomonas concharum TaxID=1031538 RepID=A0A5P1R7L5_9GAMM|nr:hypothetical protein [Neptunomonas concharum]QEQ95630.1 hypothetical protein F0U83_02320 [Neptunomonas concharum]